MATKSREQFILDAQSTLPDNQRHLIKPVDVRSRMIDLADSVIFRDDVPALASTDYVKNAFNDGDVIFENDGPNSIKRPAVQKLREWVTPEDKGARGNDANYDVRAVYDAVATGKEVRLLPGPDLLMNGDSIGNFSRGQVITGLGGALKKTTAGTGKPIFLIKPGVLDVKLRGIVFAGAVGAREYCIYTYGLQSDIAGRLLIEDCVFNREGESGPQGGGNTPIFIARHTRGVIVHKCTLRYGLGGIATGGDPLGLAGPYAPGTTPTQLSQMDGPVKNIKIIDNDFDSNDTEAIDINWDTQEFWIIGNRGTNIGRRGDPDNEMIDIGGSIDGTGSKCSDGYINGNIMVAADASGNGNPGYNNCSGGIQIKLYSEKVVAEGNIFISAKPQAANTNAARLSWARKGCSISRNQFFNFERAGYFSSPSEDSAMSDNLFDQVMMGIDFSDQASNLFKNIDLTKNRILGAPGATGSGINVRDFDGLDISYCEISGFKSLSVGFGRGVVAGNDGSGTGLKADRVSVRDCTRGMVIGSPRSSITRCRIQDTIQTGIQLSGADSVMSDNDVMRASLTTGFYAYDIFASAARSTIMQNFADDDQGAPTMRGMNFDAAGIDGLTVSGNRIRRFTGSRLNGANFLTNAIFGENWFGQNGGKTTITNAGGNVTPWLTERLLVLAGTYTADRAIALLSTNATINYRQRIVRTATGAFNADIGGLKTLSAGEWCELQITAVAAGVATWELIASGTL